MTSAERLHAIVAGLSVGKSTLVDAKTLVDAEPGTLAWFSFRLGPHSFRIFDAFETGEDREAHLQGPVAGGGLDAPAPASIASTSAPAILIDLPNRILSSPCRVSLHRMLRRFLK